MKKFKTVITFLCIIAIVVSTVILASAYSTGLDNRSVAPSVETADFDDSCLYYSILSTAGSYARKYFEASNFEADFDEHILEKTVGEPNIHNFGDIMYKCVGCNVGNGYAITSVEFLNGRGERYLKEKISENGAIIAAIAIPSDGGLNNTKYYSGDKKSFVYTGGNNDSYHAISIVGWDDNYDRTNFNKDDNGKSLGKKNGAWICKNSYGTDFGDDGYFYMSYTTPILYAAALEVGNFSGLNLILNTNQLINYIGFVYGINIRAYSDSVEDIIVTVGGKTAFQGEVKLKNGCNLILFDKPVLSGTVHIIGNNISTSSETVYCYTSLLPMKNKVTVKPAAVDENWIEDTEEIYISVERGHELCKTGNISHIVHKNSNNNCCYIYPADGYRFTKDTIIEDIYDFDDNRLYFIYGDDYCEFELYSTIEEVINADYKRLKDGNGNYITMIDFDPEWDSGRGMLKIVGQSVGSAYVNELNILTDEKGAIKDTVLTFDDGSSLTVETKKTFFADQNRIEEINSIEGLEEYFACIKVSGYYSKDLTVKINGTPTECEIKTDATETTVKVKISISDITQTPAETIKTIKIIFARVFEWFRLKNVK